MTKLTDLCNQRNTTLAQIKECLLQHDHINNYINTVDAHNRTALMRASYHGHTEIVKLLIQAGADVNISNNDSATALTLASREDIVTYLEYALELQVLMKYNTYQENKNNIEMIKKELTC